MINYDPLQTQLSLGAYSGAINPFGLPWAQTLQSPVNPLQGNPFAGIAQNGGIPAIMPQGYPGGQQGYGVNPNYAAVAQLQQQLQQLQQLAAVLAAQSSSAAQGALAAQGGIPQAFGLTPQASPFQNPLLNPILAQQLAMQAVSQYGQPQTPFPQTPFAQFGYPLAPQSWVGQAGLFGGGQIHPHHLSHLAARGLYQG